MTSRLRVWLERVCSEELLETIVLPALADLEHEQTCGGLTCHETRGVRSRVVGSDQSALSRFSLANCSRYTRDVPDARYSFRGGPHIRHQRVGAAPHSPYAREARISHSLLTLVYLSPQAMAVAFPIAAFVAVVMHGIATRASASALMRGILPFVLGLSLASLVLTFWVMPASNQAFRMLVYNASRPATEAFRDLPEA